MKPFSVPAFPIAAALSATEQMEESELVFPTDNLTAASSTKYTNILVEVQIAVNQVRNLTFFLNNTSTVDLRFYDSSVNTLAYIMDNSANSLEVSYTPFGSDPSGTAILQCAYNTTAAFTTASNAITTDVNGGMYTDLSSITIHHESVVSMLKVQVGDISGDGLVNAVDAQMALQAGVNTITLTHAQALAGDVNRDGTVDAVDSLKINQYAVSTILSFWGSDSIVPITAPSASPVISGKRFHIKNVATGEYLSSVVSSSVTTTCVVDPLQKGNTAASTNYFVSYGSSGFVAMQSPIDNKYIGFNEAGDLYHYSSSGSYPIFWYAVPTTGGFYLVNRNDTSKVISAEGLSRDIGTAVWTFELVEVNINYFYDYGYAARRGSNAVRSINQYKDDIVGILSTVFGVTVNVSNTTTKWRSYADTCFGSTTITGTNIEGHWCNHCDNVGDDKGQEACGDYSSISNVDIYEAGHVHHKNSVAALQYLRLEKQPKDDEDILDIQLLISGHSPCGEKINGVNHVFNNVGGQAYWTTRVAAVFNAASGANDYYDRFSVLHELSHCLGAGHWSNSKADKGEEYNHINCIMSYEKSKEHVLNAWDKNSSLDYTDMYCSDCKNEMKEFLSFNF